MITLRKAHERGTANFGWLNSKHTFSFGSYYDAQHNGFSKLRVINDDTVAGGAGFGTHGHRDMEIISYVTQGVIEHKDSMGNVHTLPKGEFQLMSAGSGVHHSEYNGSKTDGLKFLQIWIEPNEHGGKPGYQQKKFANEPGITAIITPDGKDGTLDIRQDASLYQIVLIPGQTLDLPINDTRKHYIHQVEGDLTLADVTLHEGDGAKIENQNSLSVSNTSDTNLTALYFDLP